ncbi:tobamovirus multiplication protein 2A-like [Populus alba x Populus x berolinensis]|nr:tobamovirus multiplication protein 2A-like [Populus alba x Populus x berolinensis]
MACKGCLECLLKLLNFLLTLVGLAMIGYGIYLFVEYKRADDNVGLVSTPSDGQGLTLLGRPMLIAVSLSESIFDRLPKAWFIYLFIAVGVLPTDKSGDFDMIYKFLKENWNIVKWVALGIVILEALIFLLTLVVRAVNRPVDYDSDDEFIASRQQTRQPLLNRPPAPATGVPVTGTLDQRPGRNDAWSTRMREKYGLDTSEFSYNPSEPHRLQPAPAQPTEERSRCTIM